MRKQKVFTGLNIGATQIACAVCTVEADGKVRVLGLASSKPRGIKRGAVSDLGGVSSSVAEAVEKAQAAARTKVVSLIANCDGPNVRSYNARGTVIIADKESEITGRDVERVIGAAKAIALPFDRKIIHPIIRGFILDGQEGIKDPRGMYGTRLEVDMQIVTSLITNVQNFCRAINMAGFEVDAVTLSGIAAAQASLEGLEKDLGVVFIYISAAATHIVVYNAGEIKHVEVLPMGAGDFVEAISLKCRVPHEQAEDILRKNAVLDGEGAEEDERFSVKVGGATRLISAASVREAIKPKAKELLCRLSDRLKDIAFVKETASGCVVVGELSNLGGFLEMMELSLNMPVKMGLAKGVICDASDISKPDYLACFGLVKYFSQEALRSKPRFNILRGGPVGKLVGKIEEIFSDYF